MFKYALFLTIFAVSFQSFAMETTGTTVSDSSSSSSIDTSSISSTDYITTGRD
jgi:hypothetical protein